MNRFEKTLELDKVLDILASKTTLPDTKEKALSLRPSSKEKDVTKRLNQTEDAQTLLAKFGAPGLGSAKNICNAARRAEAGSSLSMRELLDIGETLRVFRSVREWRDHCEGIETSIDGYFQGILPNHHLETSITSVILSEDTIADNASSELSDIRRKIRSASAKLRDHLDSLIKSPTNKNALQDPIVTMREGRFVVPVKADHKNDIPGLFHGSSASGSTVFVEPMAVVEANNEIRMLTSKEEQEIERILCALSAQVGEYAGSLCDGYTLLVDLDLLFAKARFAYDIKGMRPALSSDHHLVLRHARHPLLDPSKAVPIDVELGSDFDTLVITGPNTGGKTVSLKTIGLLSLMTMCGLFPPVDDGCTIPLYTRILVDIGDEQSIEQSLSTFSAHIKNLIGILKEADEDSLVLVDELGAGTDPVEGAALAIAILEQLRLQGASIVATTHYAELKTYAVHTPRVENGCCEFDVKSLRPTYRLLIGIPGRSNAFAISERLGMDKDLVARAQTLVDEETRKVEDVVVRLEERRQALETELEEAKLSRSSAEKTAKTAKEKAEKLEEERQKALEDAQAQARAIVERAHHDADALLDEIRALRKKKNAADFDSKSASASLRKRLKNMDDEFNPVNTPLLDSDYTLPRPLKVGDTILLADIGQTGTVLALPDKNDFVEIQAGIVRTRIPLSNIRLSEAKPKSTRLPAHARAAKVKSDSEGISRQTRTLQTELDLRGYAIDEALPAVDLFIDNAVVTGINQVSIIHGKGTGKLRAAIQKHLKSHKAVKEFRLGVYGEGEDGVTIATLK
ncbi:MAG: endonuclease MutS2 [Clostridia bacterium]|nr:endonuclease MutS2 [Clostridia bacterium]